MMRAAPLLISAFALALIATPALAKPHDGGWTPPGQAKKDGDWMPPGQAKKVDQDNHDADPADFPGTSGFAWWCKANFVREGFFNHGQCVASHAHDLHNADDDEEDADEDGQDHHRSRSDRTDDRFGQIDITDILVRKDGTFRLEGVGAEDRVIVSVGGLSEQVVGFGLADPRSDGRWVVEGEWACQDSSSSHDARFRAFDLDERVSEVATFPCRVED